MSDMEKHKDLIMDMQIFLIHKYESRNEGLYTSLVQIIASDEGKEKNDPTRIDDFDEALKTNKGNIENEKSGKNRGAVVQSRIQERKDMKMQFKQKMLEKSFKKQDVSQHYGQTSKDILKKYMAWNLPPNIYTTSNTRAYLIAGRVPQQQFLDLQKETFIEWLDNVEGGTEKRNVLDYWHTRKNSAKFSEKQKLFINALEKLMKHAKKTLNGNPFGCGGIRHCMGGRRRKSRKTKRKRRKSRKTKRKRRKSRKTKKRRRRRR